VNRRPDRPASPWLLVVLLSLGAGCARGDEAEVETKGLEPGSRATHCIEYDAADLRAMTEGDLRLLVSIVAYVPPVANGIGFALFSLGADGSRGQLISRFAIHPEKTMRVEQGDAPHNFLISLAPVADQMGEKQTCFELAFAAETVEPEGGSAEVIFSLLRGTAE